MKRVLRAALVAALALPALPAHAAPGDLDASFDGDGLAFATFKGGGEGFAGSRGADGSLVVAGHAGPKLAVARFLPDGSLDPAFGGGNGRVMYTVGEGYAQANDVLVTEDGGVLVAAYAVADGRAAFHVMRLRADGTRDRTFGGDGIAVSAFAEGPATPWGLALQPDGDVVAIGTAGSEVAAARYLPDGSPDRGFGANGLLTFGIGLAAPDEGADVAVLADGDLAIVGTSDDASGIFTGRLNVDGSFDGGFGGDGWSIARGLGQEVTASAVAVRANGQIVAGGTVTPMGETCCEMVLILYGLGGGRVASFGGGDGIVELRPAGGSARLSALALGASGVVAVGGGGETPEMEDVVVARVGPDGAPDAGFGGGDGLAVIVKNGEESGYGLGVEPGGDVLVAGTRYAAGTYRFLAARVTGS